MASFLRRLLNFSEVSSERTIFDPPYYIKTYSDVASSGVDGFDHYMKHGWLEGRNPSSDFITLYYRDKHLRGQRINPLTHYVKEGIKAGLNTKPHDNDEYIEVQKEITRPFFDPTGYSFASDSLGFDPLAHYLRRGWREGAQIRTSVSIADHINQARYVTELGVSPLYHYASQKRLLELAKSSSKLSGIKTYKASEHKLAGAYDQREIKRVLSQEFDREFYLSRYQDIRLAKIDPLEHFVEFGWRENRKPTLFFDPAFYLRENPDVRDLGINPFFHYIKFGRNIGLRQNPVGLRAYPRMEAPNNEAWASAIPAADLVRARCVVIMPVYKGSGETLAAIHAILTARQMTPFALYVIDDCSPDQALSDKLTELAARRLFLLSVNKENLGFVKTVNAALRLFPDRTIVLMNTDAKVSGDWLDRMIAHAERNSTIATVTPFSNNATIFSYPLLNENNVIEMEVDLVEVDRLAARANNGRSSEVPVGVGFCLLMSVAARETVGMFDEEAFGRGYGEESDFCMRAAKAGFSNVLAEDVFVYHVGQVSFGGAISAEPPGQKVLAAKHPEYRERIRQHLKANATEPGRIRLDLIRLARSTSPKPTVVVYHALAGGILTHVQDEIRRLKAAGTGVILIRVGAGSRWNVEITSGASAPPFTPNLRAMAFGQYREHLADFFGWLNPGLIHIHSFVGFDWHATVGFMDLVQATGTPYRFTVHDYSVVCHRNDLVLADNVYCGLPEVERCRLCVATDPSYPEAIDPAVLRTTYSRFLQGAARVQAPSRDVSNRLHRAGAKYEIDVVPHDERWLETSAIVSPAQTSLLNVVTIGAIGAHKGSRIILSLAQDANGRGIKTRFHIVGYSDIPEDLAEAGVTETGRFSTVREALETTASLSPSLIFLPSIWPETWSYTLSMAFALRIPPVVFDIGAPAERIRDRGFGEILPYALINDIKLLNERLIAIGRERAKALSLLI